MWLKDSSIGRKLIMSITGAALILFLLFHGTMNVVAIISPKGYNMICEFLGANWYALVATVGLAVLVVLHIIYAFYLSVLNYRARGRDRYAVNKKQEGVEWSSKNMLVLGVIVLLGIGLHLYNFWYKMQWTEIHHMIDSTVDASRATDGIGYIRELFACPVHSLIYLVWLCALWFHLTHGFWSAFHTLGWNNDIWMKRLKVISYVISSLIVLMFAAVVVYYYGVSLGAGCATACCGA